MDGLGFGGRPFLGLQRLDGEGDQGLVAQVVRVVDEIVCHALGSMSLLSQANT